MDVKDVSGSFAGDAMMEDKTQNKLARCDTHTHTYKIAHHYGTLMELNIYSLRALVFTRALLQAPKLNSMRLEHVFTR